MNVSIFFHLKISERSTLSFNVSGKYAPGDRDGWRVDTTASTPGLQVKLRNDGDSRNYSFGANLGYRYKLGKKGSVNASYSFSRDYARSKQQAVDFLSDPQGVVDTINSYHYTTDTYTHSLQTSLQYRSGDVWIMAGLGGVLYDIARSERFPKEERFPRLFFQLNPTVYLSVGKSRKRFSFNLASFPQMIPLDALRSTLNATNPLSLQAGNPGLKLQNDLSGSAGFQFTDVKKALSFSVRLNGSYTFNYIAQRRTLFLEDTYLPQYDYTARKGAQLTTQTNVGGNYNLGGRVSYSQQINPLRSTLNVSVNYGFSQTPYFTGEDLFHSVRHSLGFGFGFDSGFSSKVKLNIRSNTSMSSYTTQKETAQELREQLTARVDLRFGKYFGSVGTLYEFYCNSRSHALTRHNVILNASAGRKFGKENRLGLSVGVIDILNYVPQPRVLKLEPEKINALLGTDIAAEEMVSILKKLDFQVEGDQVTVPSWRSDVEAMADLAEEVARFHGYNNIPTTLMRGQTTRGGYSPEQELERALGAVCRACGYDEIITYSFISPTYYDKIRWASDDPRRQSFKILNPLGEDTSIMRTTVLPSMLEILTRNYNFRNKCAKLYEVGRIYLPGGADGLAVEKKVLSLGAYGEGMDFFALKGAVEAILGEIRAADVTFEAPQIPNPSYHPGRCAQVLVNGQEVGVFGQIHPLVAQNYGVDAEFYCAELDFDQLMCRKGPDPQYVPLPKFPAVTRDIAVVCGEAVTVGALEDCIRRGAKGLLKEVTLFDIYRGKGVAEGKKSVAFNLVLRADDRSLTAEEADADVKAILETLEKELGAVLC